MQVIFTSDCCGCEMSFGQVHFGICPQCHEHCEILTDDSMERDYISGFDDGEGI